MENIYLVFVIILFVLAISDLIVGVSNDAVNFLNSAIGAKAAPGHIIMVVASLGVLIGATFSSGMMEVARKGIFHPEMFTFPQIMTIFLAVMLTDVILLDLFNTIGLPTSTTVSIVFELLGAAVAVSAIIIMRNEAAVSGTLSDFINSDKALAIIGGILLSVVFAFFIGSIVQYISRLFFSFRYKQNLKYMGSVFGGLAISAITYFIVIKGLKGTSFIPDYVLDYVKTHTFTILAISFVGWTMLLQLLYIIFKTNAPRVVVLVGTFALAMAFAGNDLVNFIGVPLAGLASFKAYAASGVAANEYTMEILSQPVQSGTFILLGAGAIMIATLWTSSKAKSVVATTVDLSRQDEGTERFSSSGFSRFMVRTSVNMSENLGKILPDRIIKAIESRFQRPEEDDDEKDKPAFDMIRAAVNLSVASILIAIATSMKLPLSTTYVTFMVAMGTSLADRAWGRDSAVYRITGVFTVITGWFMTALIAFTASFIVASFLFYAKLVGVIVMVAIAAFFIIKTHVLYKKNVADKKAAASEKEKEFIDETGKYVERSNNAIKTALLRSSKIYFIVIQGLIEEDRRKLKSIRNEVIDFNMHVKDLKDNLYKFMKKMNLLSIETGHYYVQVLDYMREMAHAVQFMVDPVYEHVANKHKGLNADQKEELLDLAEKTSELFNHTIHFVKEMKYSETADLITKIEEQLSGILAYRKAQIKRIKKGNVNTRNSMLYLGILQETKNLLLFLINLMKAQRDFVIFTEKSSAHDKGF